MALTIGQVARAANVHMETLRYYERRGLVPKPPRSRANYRCYPEDTVRRVRFVKHVQDLGSSLREIRELLALCATPRGRRSDVRSRAEENIGAIDAKIASLRTMRRALVRLVSQCDGRLPVTP